jgi:hypothetical protein
MEKCRCTFSQVQRYFELVKSPHTSWLILMKSCTILSLSTPLVSKSLTLAIYREEDCGLSSPRRRVDFFILVSVSRVMRNEARNELG